MHKICGHCINYGMLYVKTHELAEQASTCRNSSGLHYDPSDASWIEATRDASDCEAFYPSPEARTAEAAECLAACHGAQPVHAASVWRAWRKPQVPCRTCKRRIHQDEPCPFCGAPAKPRHKLPGPWVPE